MEETKSLYNYIKEHMEGDALPESFSLPQEPGNEIQFADGAKDGIAIYHVQHTEMEDEELNKIHNALKLVSDGESQKAEEQFIELAKKHSIITIIDEIQQCIMVNKEELNARKLYEFAVDLLIDSDNKELVKIGMVILELFKANDALKEAVRVIGLSDEFTIFSIFLMRAWDNANMEILSLAKKVRGWGRIHAIEFIEPENDEIREWILKEGIHNQVMSAYSALTCYQKAGVEELLQKDDLTYEEFHAIAEIMEALLDEGPVAGISEVENKEVIMKKFLSFAAKMKLTAQDQEILRSIFNYIDDHRKDKE